MNVGKKAADALRLLNEMDPEKLVSFFYCFGTILLLQRWFVYFGFGTGIHFCYIPAQYWHCLVFDNILHFFAQTRLFPKLLVSFLGSVARQMVSKILYINKCNMCTVLPPYIGRHISFVASIDTCYHACFWINDVYRPFIIIITWKIHCFWRICLLFTTVVMGKSICAFPQVKKGVLS